MLGGRQARGVTLSLLASGLFGVIFYLAGVVDASAEVMFGWRAVILAAGYLLVCAVPAGRRRARELAGRLAARPRLILVLCVTSPLIAGQLWLFTWAPAHGHALDVALGYLLLPIALVALGRVTFGEVVSGAQWIAVAIAVVAVAVSIAAAGVLSWVVCFVIGGNAAYLGLRRRFGLEGPEALGAEALLAAPVALAFLVAYPAPATVGAYAVVFLIGALGAIALTAYLGAAGMLSLPMFGLLTYTEPVGLFVTSLLLGARLSVVDGVVYALLAAALTVLAVAGFRSASRRPKVIDVPVT